MRKMHEEGRRNDAYDKQRRSVLSRRAFLGNVALGVGGLLWPHRGWAGGLGGETDEKARVVIVRNPAVISEKKLNAEIAEEMVHRAVCLLTQKESRSLAWKALFSPKEKVAIKVNARHPPVAGNREIASAIVNGLKDAGVEENRIIIFDFLDEELTRLGYTLNDSSRGVRCYAIRECSEMKAGPVVVKLSKIITDEADAIINVPAFRHHGVAGMTVSMKNHLGSVRNPSDLHRENCLHVADLNALDPIRKKTRLIIADAVLGQYNGGPSYRPPFVWEYAGLIAGNDPVAVDTVAWHEIEAERHKRGIEGPIRPAVRHIPRAAEMGLGIGDLKKINVVRWPA